MTTIHEVTIGDSFRYNSLEYVIVDVLIPTSQVTWKQGLSNNTGTCVLSSLEGSPVFQGWTYQYQKTVLTAVNKGAPIPAPPSLPPLTWTGIKNGTGIYTAPAGRYFVSIDDIKQSFKTEPNGCPACDGETELKTFSSFSYTYCPKCKEDVAVLAKKATYGGMDLAMPAKPGCECAQNTLAKGIQYACSQCIGG